MRKQIFTSLCEKSLIYTKEINTKKSETQPDMQLSLFDLINNHTTSGRMDIFFEPNENIPDLADFKAMDLTERQDLIENGNFEIADLQTQQSNFLNQIKEIQKKPKASTKSEPKGEDLDIPSNT